MRRRIFSLRRAILGLAAAAMPWAANPAAAQVQISPVIVDLPAGKRASSLRVRNTGVDTLVFEAEAYDWTQAEGRDRLNQSRDLVVTPSVFSVAPNQTQIVRIAALGAASPAKERAYRLMLRQVAQTSPVSAGVRLEFKVDFSIPVFEAPSLVRPTPLKMTASRNAEGAAILRLINPANVRAQIGAIDLRDGGAVRPLPNAPRYLLAGAVVEQPATTLGDAATARILYARGQDSTPVDLRLALDAAGP